MPTLRTALLPIRLCMIAAVLFLAACNDASGPERLVVEAGNVDVRMDAAVAVTDSGVVVNGAIAIAYPGEQGGLVIDRFEDFVYGGFPDHDYPQSARYSHAWLLRFMHRRAAEQRGDSTIFRYADHGPVSTDGHEMDKGVLPPFVSPNLPVHFDSFVVYRARPLVRVDWMHGHTTHQAMPYFASLTAGSPLTFSTTGSAEAAALSASFAAKPFAALQRVYNGEAVDLDSERLLISTREPLVLEFDRPLDAAATWLLMGPFVRVGGQFGRAAFLRLTESTRRVVIPAAVLEELRARFDIEHVPVRLSVTEVLVTPDVIAGRRPDGSEPFSLPLLQHGWTTLHLYLRR
jgi:hypothetical protein